MSFAEQLQRDHKARLIRLGAVPAPVPRRRIEVLVPASRPKPTPPIAVKPEPTLPAPGRVSILPPSLSPVTLIVKAVAQHYGVAWQDICYGAKTNRLVFPRQVAMWVAKTCTNKSLPEIGRKIGGRDHTTILYGYRKIETMRATDPALQADLDKFVAMFAPREGTP